MLRIETNVDPVTGTRNVASYEVVSRTTKKSDAGSSITYVEKSDIPRGFYARWHAYYVDDSNKLRLR